MADKAEIINLQRDVSYVKHQLACVMHALKVKPCGCYDCLENIPPSSILSTNENVAFDSKQLTLNCSQSTPHVITSASSPDDRVLRNEENGNLSDDVLQMVGSSSCNSPELGEHNYYGMLKPFEATARCIPTNVLLLKDVPKVVSPATSIVKRETPSKDGTSSKQKREETIGRKRKISTLDSDHSPVKYDIRGRCYYSKEQKKAIYDTYLVKGLQETAKEFGSTVTAIYNHVHRYKINQREEKAKLICAERLRTSIVAKARQKVHRQQKRQKVKKVDDDLAPPTFNGIKISPSGRRYYSREMKLSIYKYYVTHGRNATMKHFNMTAGIFTYLMYHKTHVALRRSVKADLSVKAKRNEADEEENVAENSVTVFVKEEINGDENDFKLSKCEPGYLVPKIEERMNIEQESLDDRDADNSSIENGSSLESGKKKSNYKGRKKILTDDQEEQLYHVLRTLEEKGTRITPNILIYAAKQILKRAADDVDTNNIRISFSYAMVSLRRYREQKV